MNKIIATTDFSDVSLHAVHYACKMAHDLDATLTLIHAYIIPVTFNDTPMPVMPIEETRALSEERLNNLCKHMGTEYAGLQISCELMYGDIVDCVEEYASEEPVFMVIMGNSSSDGIPLWMGSNLVNGLKKLNIPVMGVPLKAEYSGIHNICLACDLKDMEKELPVKQLLALTARVKAKLHVLNISTDEKKRIPDVNLRLNELLAPLQPEYHFVVKEDINEGIQEFVTQNKFEWLMVAPHKYSFLESLFHRSHTNAMVRMMNVPVVALHRETK